MKTLNELVHGTYEVCLRTCTVATETIEHVPTSPDCVATQTFMESLGNRYGNPCTGMVVVVGKGREGRGGKRGDEELEEGGGRG